MSLPKFLLESRICNKDTCEIKRKLDQYEDPDDLTLFYMWLDEKAKDKMKQLQEEKEKYKHKFWEEQEQNEYLQDRIKELETINEEHRKLNGELREEKKDLLEETSKLTKLWLKEKVKNREAIFDLQKLECLDNIHVTNNAQWIIDDIIKKLQGSDE